MPETKNSESFSQEILLVLLCFKKRNTISLEMTRYKYLTRSHFDIYLKRYSKPLYRLFTIPSNCLWSRAVFLACVPIALVLNANGGDCANSTASAYRVRSGWEQREVRWGGWNLDRTSSLATSLMIIFRQSALTTVRLSRRNYACLYQSGKANRSRVRLSGVILESILSTLSTLSTLYDCNYGRVVLVA